jgi:hypothetical protein
LTSLPASPVGEDKRGIFGASGIENNDALCVENGFPIETLGNDGVGKMVENDAVGASFKNDGERKRRRLRVSPAITNQKLLETNDMFCVDLL